MRKIHEILGGEWEASRERVRRAKGSRCRRGGKMGAARAIGRGEEGARCGRGRAWQLSKRGLRGGGWGGSRYSRIQGVVL
ncbi:hypothetical protein IEQ34_008805 [Dendrobium chrysotoxum]|uniref:Uncharacterized protein n=1 Tax=Dendrobium chrysotoxum TaxID=161865 RepID=A0AAV7GYQ9_DENCH|nr:hypothetical protein IEQ34_008805 [Dendrobium chrysotoxum]